MPEEWSEVKGDSEEVVLKTVDEVVEEAEKRIGAWPELDEPEFISADASFAQRVTVWTMAGILIAITVYAIATADQRVLLVVVAVAAGTLGRLTGLKSRRHTPRKRIYDRRRKRRKKRIEPH